MNRIPRTVTPLADEYINVGNILADTLVYGFDIYHMTRKEFIHAVMTTSRGKMNPVRVSQIYDDLMKDAGLDPLE